ncbi:MAG: class I SAM-dependent methyltransferase [Dehalococcoidia bacterium]|nr:class I SAM-dependent methyltransferase [Dehalococcoidia bacterium]
MTSTQSRYPRIGTLDGATERDDTAYLDFIEGMRVFNGKHMTPVLWQRYEELAQAFEREFGRKPTSLEDMKQTLDQLPILQAHQRMFRSLQEMRAAALVETYGKRQEELIRELDEWATRGPGTLQLDPNFEYPEYSKTVYFHLQPGGYADHPLAGYIYHYGTKMLFAGTNDNDERQREMVFGTPLPADGNVRRVLDLACACGQSTTAWKERLPNAEVWGIDISAPMLRYAHKRAVDMGLEVHFAQRAAEQSGFESGSFDMVYAFIFFHEIPVEICKAVVREAHRLLRPGGVFVVMDFPSKPGANVKITNPTGEYFRDFDTNDNGEPYASDFVYWDFHGYLREIFGNDVVENVSPKTFLPMRAAWKQ